MRPKDSATAAAGRCEKATGAADPLGAAGSPSVYRTIIMACSPSSIAVTRCADHRSELAATVLPGVFTTLTDSVRSFPRHWHAGFGLGMIERGAQRSASGRGTVEAHAGHCISHNPGEVHDGTPIDDAGRRWRMFHVDPDAMARLLGVARVESLEWHKPVMADETLHACLRRAFEVVDASSRAPSACLQAEAGVLEEALLTAVGRALEVRRARQSRSIAAPHLEVARDRLADEVRSAPTLDELAALAGKSRYALVRQFRHCYGLPPMAWLMQLRLQRARERIAGGWSLAEAALGCGFSDQSHLTRMFTRQFGYTPGSWRMVAAGQGQPRARSF
jgi:AraC-like DNA-binding protein